jgi:hypothetical protein
VAIISSACGAQSLPTCVKVPAPADNAPSLNVGVIANTIGPQPAMGETQQRADDLGVHWIREQLDQEALDSSRRTHGRGHGHPG